MLERITNCTNLASERSILLKYLNDNSILPTAVKEVEGRESLPNSYSQNHLGLFRPRESRKIVTVDTSLIEQFRAKSLEIPSFLEAGPRDQLKFSPQNVRAAIVCAGGVAPGIHSVIHGIVKRHCDTYSISQQGKIFGVYNSFKGLSNLADNLVELNPAITEKWLDRGGCQLGIVHFNPNNKIGEEAIAEMMPPITQNLENNRIDILYIIGGDGSLKVAHEIAKNNTSRSAIGIPKTMDNDVLWVWESFGFETAVEQATRVINTLQSDAEATRRICLIELFGAESGFVAANASEASGHVDAVLIPEVFLKLNKAQAKEYLCEVIQHVKARVENRDEEGHNPHSVVVLGEGVGAVLEEKGITIGDCRVEKKNFVYQLKEKIEREKVVDAHGEQVPVFINQPRHFIRAVPASSHDEIYYCERLGALAVDSALAGYTDCMISQWLTEFVLVPLELVQLGKKSIPVNGMFWKQVVSTTGQPLSSAERADSKCQLPDL